MGLHNKYESIIRTTVCVCVYAMLFLSMVAGAPHPRPLQPARDDEYSGQAVGMGLYAMAEKPNAAWKQVVPEVTSFQTEDQLMVPVPVGLMLLNSDRRYKRQAPESPDAPVEPFSVTTDKSEEATNEGSSSSGSSSTASETTDATEVEVGQMGNLTLEDMQELDSFYTKAREQILRTHRTRLEVENLKNGKSISSKSLLGPEDAKNTAAESSEEY